MQISRSTIAVAILITAVVAIPPSTDAASPTTLVRTRRAIERSSGGLRVEQNVRRRKTTRRMPEIDARRQQQRPAPRIRKVSQRSRRAQTPNPETRERHLDRGTLRPEEATPIRSVSEQQELKDAVIRLVNREREKADLPPLAPNSTLAASAQAYAQDMLQRDFFSHTSPEGEGPQKRIERAGFAALTSETCKCKGYYASFGENLAKGQQTPADVMRGWMESPDHRKNILTSHFTDIGIGLVGTIWVQHFGSLKIDPR